jgi:hypothetical protein
MTDGQTTRAVPRRPGPWPVIAGSLALFLIMLAFLVLQLRAGRDSALRAGATPAKRVLIRRQENRVVITRVVADDGRSGGDESGDESGAVAQAAPAPAAPAPASPPVSTGSS